MTGAGKEIDGLHYFKVGPISSRTLSHTHFSSSQSTSNQEIQLGHTQLSLFEKIFFPTLLKDKDTHNFQWEICELSKHHQAHFPTQIYNMSHPFSLRYIVTFGDLQMLKTYLGLGG